MLDQGYGIIPNSILFDKNLSDKQKLLFCLISSLCAEKGYCWASNKHLGERLDVKICTISVNIKALVDFGYIKSEVSKNYDRKISIHPLGKIIIPHDEKSYTPPNEKSSYNNTTNNNTREYNKILSKDSIKAFKEFIETNKDNTSAIVLSYFFDLGYKPAELETVDTFRKWMEDAAKQSGKTAEQIKLKVFEWHTYFSIKKVKNHKSSFLNWITKEFKGTKSK